MRARVKTERSKDVPREIAAALAALDNAEEAVANAKTYVEWKESMRWVEAIKAFWRDIEQVRTRAEIVLLIGGWHAGRRAVAAGNKQGGDRKSKLSKEALIQPPTLVELFGSRTRGSRLKRLGGFAEREIRDIAEELHAIDKEATLTATLKALAAIAGKKKRKASRDALPLADGMDLRIGDARAVLADIADNSVPLILTDPPYGDEAEPLYQWLAEFAARTLIPGGSLICYTGQSRLNRDVAIFDQHLRYWWLMMLPHKQPQRFPGKFVLAGFKPVLWYVKEKRRGRELVSDVLHDMGRDKSDHDWGQGEAGTGRLIDILTDPGETIVDPFAGTATWGRIAASLGRRWIGADIEKWGDTTIRSAAE